MEFWEKLFLGMMVVIFIGTLPVGIALLWYAAYMAMFGAQGCW